MLRLGITWILSFNHEGSSGLGFSFGFPAPAPACFCALAGSLNHADACFAIPPQLCHVTPAMLEEQHVLSPLTILLLS